MNSERFRKLTEVLNRRQPDLTVLMDSVHKEHNLAAILRTCDAVGVLRAHAVLPPDGSSMHNHTSAGARKWVEVVRHDTVDAAVRRLKADGFTIVAAHPADDAVDFRTVDYRGPIAIMMGAELHGLSERGLAAADQVVAIPQVGMVQSLNVSVATALMLYEAQRQRRKAGLYDRPRIDVSQRRRLLFEWAYPRVSRHLREQGLPYPELDAEGQIVRAMG